MIDKIFIIPFCTILFTIVVVLGIQGIRLYSVDEFKQQYEKGFKQGQIEASKGNWKYKQVEVKTWVKNKEEVK